MVKRLVDILLCGAALIFLLPVMLAAVVGILISDPGPVIYRAKRVGRNGRIFDMYKFRSMYVVQPEGAAAITAAGDSRIFPFGRFIRKTKIDELPQLINVLLGDMSVVGPRPEDARIVESYFGEIGRETLNVRPGLASPGSIFNYTHGDALLGKENAEINYIERVLPIKLAIELAYVRHANLAYDFRIIGRTIKTILLVAMGRQIYPNPPEMEEALNILGKS